MNKTVPFKMPASKPQAADAWVDEGVEPHLKQANKAPAPTPAVMKRLTLDISEELHARVKAGCAQRRMTMLQVICSFLDAEFPNQS
jgi:ParG